MSGASREYQTHSDRVLVACATITSAPGTHCAYVTCSSNEDLVPLARHAKCSRRFLSRKSRCVARALSSSQSTRDACDTVTEATEAEVFRVPDSSFPSFPSPSKRSTRSVCASTG